MDRKLENRELISDLADGRLDDADAIKLLDQMTQDDDAALAWQTYHLSRDVLRGDWAGAGDPVGGGVGWRLISWRDCVVVWLKSR